MKETWSLFDGQLYLKYLMPEVESYSFAELFNFGICQFFVIILYMQDQIISINTDAFLHAKCCSIGLDIWLISQCLLTWCLGVR